MSASTDLLQSMRLDGRTVRYVRTDGSGLPLVVIGDLAVNAEILIDFCQAISCPTLLIDWPATLGPGRGRWLRMPAVADIVIALLDHLQIARVDGLGMGWGGVLAQALAYRHADRIRRLVLVASSAGQIMLPGRLANWRRLGRRTGLANIAADGREARALFGGRGERECSRIAQGLSAASPPGRRAMLAQLYALSGFSSVRWAHRIRAPCLILAGDDDRIVPLANARLLGFLLARSELSIMHGAGHWLLLEREAEAIRRIEAFLAGKEAEHAR